MSFLNDILDKIAKKKNGSDASDNDEGKGQRERERVRGSEQPIETKADKPQETPEKKKQVELYQWRPGEKEAFLAASKEYELKWAREHSPDDPAKRVESRDDERVR